VRRCVHTEHVYKLSYAFSLGYALLGQRLNSHANTQASAAAAAASSQATRLEADQAQVRTALGDVHILLNVSVCWQRLTQLFQRRIALVEEQLAASRAQLAAANVSSFACVCVCVCVCVFEHFSLAPSSSRPI
jgi:hypothetical protein